MRIGWRWFRFSNINLIILFSMKNNKNGLNDMEIAFSKIDNVKVIDSVNVIESSLDNNEVQSLESTNCLATPLSNEVEENNKIDIIEAEKAERKLQIEKYGARISSIDTILNSEECNISYVIDKLKPRGELSMIYGGSGEGKSMLERCYLLAIAYGLTEYLGFKIDLPPEDRKVCLIITEDSEKSIRTLLKKQASYFEQFRTIENPVFDIISSVEDNISNVLKKRLEEVNYSVVVIDTPQDDIEGSMNDNNVIRQYLKSICNLAEEYDFALTIIHHKRKYTGDKEPSKEDLSGSQALNAKPRCIYELRENVNNPNYRNLTPVKANYESNEFLKTSIVIEMNPETLTFSDTGIRMASDQVHVSLQKSELNEKIIQKIQEYRNVNLNIKQSQIVELLRDEFPGLKINQSRVCRLMKKM